MNRFLLRYTNSCRAEYAAQRVQLNKEQRWNICRPIKFINLREYPYESIAVGRAGCR